MAHSDWRLSGGVSLTLLVAATFMTIAMTTARGVPPSNALTKPNDSNKNGLSSGRSDARSSFPSGQPETFSSKATGLGDLAATDSLKKMNKRSSMFGNRRDSYLDIEPSLGERRESFGRASAGARAHLAFGAGIEAPYRSLMASMPGKQLYALHRMSPTQVSSSSGGSGSLMGPIVITRRTEELLEPPVSKITELQLEEDDQPEKFPLLGEFGSRVSFITTRKAQPSNQLDLDSDYLQDGEDKADLSLAYQMDDVEPVSSQVLINPAKLRKTDDLMHSSHLQQPVPTRIVLDGDNEKTVRIMDYMDPNYIPRFARGFM